MSHEPECVGKGDVLDGLLGPRPCICPALRAAYTAGRADAESDYQRGYDDGYRHGYNDHARSREIGMEMFGYVQHGKGENP